MKKLMSEVLAFWKFLAILGCYLVGAILVMASFFFEKISDWPKHLLAFSIGLCLVTAAYVYLKRTMESKK